MSKIRQEELQEIKDHPAGRALWRYLRRRVQNLTEQWAAGQFNSENPQVCTVANVSAVSVLKAIQAIIDIDIEDLNEEIESGGKEQFGLPPSRARSSTSSV